MSNFITSPDEWIVEYRKDKYQIWIRVTASNKTEYYLQNYQKWVEFKNFCDNHKLKIDKICLQYKSHIVEINCNDADGLYVTKSVIGQCGEKSKDAITIGKVYGKIVKKTMWVIPELIESFKDEDPIEKCFQEAIIIYD
jgi:hypothetical protein